MSYRELRDFTEHMKTLGYPSALSIDSFRQPNFPLVSSLLLFLLHRYDPTLVPPEDISTQPARIHFIQSVTAMLLSKCHIKLSMKQLYKSDGYAVKEMLKLSTTLYQAMSSSSSSSTPTLPLPSSSSTPSPPSFDSFKDAKTLSSDLIDLGERLSSLLSLEPTVRPLRDRALVFVDSLSVEEGRGGVERQVRRQMGLMEEQLKELREKGKEVRDDVEKMRGKLERKEGERERMDKRWKALKRVKPQFMEEFEREEAELRGVYGQFVERMRNVQWLEQEMKELRREEEDEKKESDRRLVKMQKRLREEEMKILRGGEGSEEEEERDDEKRGYERKDRGEDEEEEEEEEEEDEDEDDEKRPMRREATGRPGAVVKGRGSAGTGRSKGRPAARGSGSDELNSESETSGLGEDDYF